MNTEVPHWTEPGSLGDRSPLFPLGLAQHGFRLVRFLVPGMTGATRHPRYYSFFCWVYWTYARRIGEDGTASKLEQQQWRQRLENAMRAATMAEPDHLTPLPGSSAQEPASGPPDAELQLEDDAPVSAWTPVQYRPSWQLFGCGRLQGGITVLNEDIGVRLAESFHERLEQADPSGDAIARLLSDAPTITHGKLRTLRQGLALTPIPLGSSEHAAVFDLLFRPNAEPVGQEARSDRRRSLTLTLFLSLIREGEGAISRPSDFHRPLATGRFHDGSEYRPPEVLEGTYRLWQRYEERQQQKLSLYGFWHFVLQLLLRSHRGIPTPTIQTEMIDELSRSPLLTEWLGSNAIDCPVGDALDALAAAPGERGEDLNEIMYAFTQRVLRPESEKHAAASLLLMLFSAVRWESMQATLTELEAAVHTEGGEVDLPLGLFATWIRKQEKLTLRELCQRVLERFILERALAVAVAKGDDRFFIARDADGFLPVQEQDPSVHLKYDGPRFQSGTDVLSDLGLVTQGEAVQLTEAGEEHLALLLQSHEEHLGSAYPA